MSKHPFELLRDDAFKLFKTIANEISEQNVKILKQADAIRLKPKYVPPVTETPGSRFWLAVLITLGVIVLLGIFIVGPIICCLKKRGAFSSEHVDEEIELEEDEEHQRSPRGHVAMSPGGPKAISPGGGVGGGGGRHLSPLARSPKSPRPGMSPRPRTPIRLEPQRRGKSPMGLSPMRNRSY